MVFSLPLLFFEPRRDFFFLPQFFRPRWSPSVKGKFLTHSIEWHFDLRFSLLELNNELGFADTTPCSVDRSLFRLNSSALISPGRYRLLDLIDFFYFMDSPRSERCL